MLSMSSLIHYDTYTYVEMGYLTVGMTKYYYIQLETISGEHICRVQKERSYLEFFEKWVIFISSTL